MATLIYTETDPTADTSGNDLSDAHLQNKDCFSSDTVESAKLVHEDMGNSEDISEVHKIEADPDGEFASDNQGDTKLPSTNDKPSVPDQFWDEKPRSAKRYFTHNSMHVILCKHCGMDFTNPSSLRLHVRKKHRELNLKCPKCKKMHDYGCPYTEHEQREHCGRCCGIETKIAIRNRKQTNVFPCRVCNRRYPTSALLEEHQKVHQQLNSVDEQGPVKAKMRPSKYKTGKLTSDEYRCKLCDKTYDKESTLRNHIKYTHRELNVQCPKCAKMHDFGCTNTDHEERTHCGRCCTLETVASRRMNGNTVKKNVQTFSCKVCHRHYAELSLLEEHRKIHAAEEEDEAMDDAIIIALPTKKRNNCKQCGQVFEYSWELLKHVGSVHSRSLCAFCPTCARIHDYSCPYESHAERKHCDYCCGLDSYQSSLWTDLVHFP